MKSLLALLGMFAFPVMAATTVSASSMISMLVWIVVIGLIFWLLWWLIGYIGLPQPFDKVARVVLALVAVLILINFLLGFAGNPIVRFG